MNDIDELQDRMQDLERRFSHLEGDIRDNPIRTQNDNIISNLEEDVKYWRGKAEAYEIKLQSYGHEFE